MASQDDCYFYYNSTCTKGDECQFRHEPAAVGSVIMCDQWEAGRCFRPVCKFRHMMIEFDRSNIACYYESQPSGCLKEFCPFYHTKPRSVVTGMTNMVTNTPPVSVPLTSQQPNQASVPSSAPMQKLNSMNSTAASEEKQANQMSIPVLNAPRQSQTHPSQTGGEPRPQFRGPLPQQHYQRPPMPTPPQSFHPMADPLLGRGLTRPPQYVGPVRPGFVHQAAPVPSRFTRPPPRGQMPYNTGAVRHPAPGYPYNAFPVNPPGSSFTGYDNPRDSVGQLREVELYHKTKPLDEELTDDSSDFSDVLSDDEDWQDVDVTPPSHKVQRSKQDSSRNKREIRTSRKYNHSRSGKSGHVDDRRRNERQKERYNSRDRVRDGEKDDPRSETTSQSLRRREGAKSRDETDEKRREKDRKKSGKDESNSETIKTTKEKEADPEEKRESSSDIKVKSLEEILREKALKKLMERRQKQAEEAKESGVSEDIDKVKEVDSKDTDKKNEEKLDEVPVETSEGQIVTSQAKKENSESKEIEQKMTSPRKRALAVTALKSVIGRTAVPMNASDDKPPSPSGSDEIKVKSFEEIMKEKKLRRNQQTNKSDESEKAAQSVNEPPAGSVGVGKRGAGPMCRLVRKVTENEGPQLDGFKSEKKTKTKRIIRVMKPAGSSDQDSNVPSIASSKVTKKSQMNDSKVENKTNGTTENSVGRSPQLHVKTLEEIKEEKRRRALEQRQDEAGKMSENSTGDKITSMQNKQDSVTTKFVSSGFQHGKFRKLRVVRRGSGASSSAESEGPASLRCKKNEEPLVPVCKDSDALTAKIENSTFNSTDNSVSKHNIAMLNTEKNDRDNGSHGNTQVEKADKTFSTSSDSNDAASIKVDTSEMSGEVQVAEDSEDDTFDIITPDRSPEQQQQQQQPASTNETQDGEDQGEEEEEPGFDNVEDHIQEQVDDETVSPAKRQRISLEDLTSRELPHNEISEQERLEQELEEALGNLSPAHSAASLDEDDLLMEIEEMINL